MSTGIKIRIPANCLDSRIAECRKKLDDIYIETTLRNKETLFDKFLIVYFPAELNLQQTVEIGIIIGIYIH